MEKSEQQEDEFQIYLGFDHLVFFPGYPVTGVLFLKISKPKTLTRIGLNWCVFLLHCHCNQFDDSFNRFGCEQLDWVEGLIQRDSRSVQHMLFQDKQIIFPDDCMSFCVTIGLTDCSFIDKGTERRSAQVSILMAASWKLAVYLHAY
jgi:hypothetical protein